jgi:hypothetical protein
MKTIQVPAEIIQTGKDKDGKEISEPFSFRDFCAFAVNTYSLFGKGYANIKKADAIMKAVELDPKAPTISLEDEHFACLKDAVNAAQFFAHSSRKLIPFFEAFESAAK